MVVRWRWTGNPDGAEHGLDGGLDPVAMETVVVVGTVPDLDVAETGRSPDDEMHEQTGRVLWPDRSLDPFVEGFVPRHLELSTYAMTLSSVESDRISSIR